MRLKFKRRVDYFKKYLEVKSTRISFYSLRFIQDAKLSCLPPSFVFHGDLEHISASIFLSANICKKLNFRLRDLIILTIMLQDKTPQMKNVNRTEN